MTESPLSLGAEGFKNRSLSWRSYNPNNDSNFLY
jgi:hypothetical protein